MQRASWAAVAAAALGLTAAGRAEAGVIIDIFQSGSNVVATGSGSLDLTGMTHVTTRMVQPSFIFPSAAAILVGSSGGDIDVYTPLSGPASFGSGGLTSPASSGSGDLFGINRSTGQLAVPRGYVFGTSLSGSETFDNTTLSGLGLTAGTYLFRLPGDTLTVRIGSVAVPEPSTLALAGLGAAALAGYGWRRRPFK
jgi:hypothetical protein